MVMNLPLSSNVVQGLGGSVAADLLKGVAGAVAITSVGIVGGNLVIGFLDETNTPDSITFSPAAAGGASGVHYSFDLAYNSNTDQYDGTFSPVVTLITLGDLVAFETPVTVPNNDLQVVFSLPVGGVDTEFDILGITGDNFVPILNNNLTPSTLYWARVYSGLSLLILSSSAAGAISRRAERTLTNAELKTLDTDYIELIPSPGAGKYISVDSVIMGKSGDDTPRAYTNSMKMWSSTSAVVVVAEGEAATDYISDAVDLDSWTGEARYVYFVTDVTMNVPDGLTTNPNSVEDEILAADFSRIVAGVTLDGRAYNLWRSNNTYSASSEVDADRGLRFTVRSDGRGIRARPNLGSISDGLKVGLLLINDDSAPEPLFTQQLVFGNPVGSNECTPIFSDLINIFLGNAGDVSRAMVTGQQELSENAPYTLGAFRFGTRGGALDFYSSTAWDAYWSGVDDVTLKVSVQYRIHTF